MAVCCNGCNMAKSGYPEDYFKVLIAYIHQHGKPNLDDRSLLRSLAQGP